MAELKVQMDKTAIIVSSVVGSLGLLSAILGFAGEGANATYSTPGLGICAGIFLLIAQITVSAAGGCCGCCASRAIPSETKRIVGIVCAVGSWVTAVIACVLFFVFAAVPGGILAGAAVLTLVATALNITSVIMMQGHSSADAATVPVVEPVVVQVQPAVDDQEKLVTTKEAPATQSEKNGQAPYSETPPPPTTQNNRTPSQNHEGRSADTAQPSSTPGAEPADQSAPRAVAMPQPQGPPPQPHAQLQQQQLPPANVLTPQYTAVQAPHLQVHVDAAPGRISSSSTATPTGNGPTLRTTFRNEIAKATIRLTEKAVEHVLFSNNNNTTGDVLLPSMATDPTVGVDVGATDCGDSAV